MTSIKKTLIEFKNTSLQRDQKTILKDLYWEVKSQENWTIIGPNGAGKSLLAGLISGRLKGSQVTHHLALEQIQEVSFDTVQSTLDYEAWNDDSEFIEGGFDKGRSVAEFACEGGFRISSKLKAVFNLDSFLDTGLKFISNGEMRKAQILRALVRNPQILVLDGLTEGLDIKAKQSLNKLIEQLSAHTQIIHCVQNKSEIPSFSNFILCLDHCQKMIAGPRSRVENSVEFAKLFGDPPPPPNSLPNTYQNPMPIEKHSEIIRLEKVSVSYGEKAVIDQLTWSVKAGEHWGISGPNGAGKTTLLSLINADNPQGYGKDFWLFGRKRGSGESIWDIKKRIGIVTTELQLEYHQNILACDVVVSGFFDSIGLYRQADPSHEIIAQEWMQTLGIAQLANKNFETLSYGERRSVLLARAMVKSPNILILDEPCQGLDERNRQAILNTIEFLARETDMTLLYVSHKPEAQLPCLQKHLRFIPQKSGPCSFELE